MATAHYYPPPPPPIAHALPRPHAADNAVALLPDDDGSSGSESVAESSCPRQPTASGDEEEDDDGCSGSCVEADGYWGYYQQQQYPLEADDEEEVSTASVWWKKKRAAAAAGRACGVFPSAVGREGEEKKAEDPKRAAARQEEDRKFWADCLATGINHLCSVPSPLAEPLRPLNNIVCLPPLAAAPTRSRAKPGQLGRRRGLLLPPPDVVWRGPFGAGDGATPAHGAAVAVGGGGAGCMRRCRVADAVWGRALLSVATAWVRTDLRLSAWGLALVVCRGSPQGWPLGGNGGWPLLRRSLVVAGLPPPARSGPGGLSGDGRCRGLDSLALLAGDEVCGGFCMVMS
ncbi:hypothetical protein ZWY2020_009683 [Hordeum vulgare]|nr:hypothetical protein ZWY2020_009683 [Hordeum vulgare]